MIEEPFLAVLFQQRSCVLPLFQEFFGTCLGWLAGWLAVSFVHEDRRHRPVLTLA
jgi:hypothetical protein